MTIGDSADENLVPALKCEGCGLSLKDGRPHKTFRECFEVLKKRSIEQRVIIDRSAAIIKEYQIVHKLFWLLVRCTKDKCVSYEADEIASVPKDAKVKLYPTSTGMLADARK